MPDYRISQAQLLRLALLASGGDSPKFDEVFGIIREARPILDPDKVSASVANTAEANRAPLTMEQAREKAFRDAFPGSVYTRLTPGLPAAMPLGTAPLPPVTEDEPNVTGTADDATPPAKPE